MIDERMKMALAFSPASLVAFKYSKDLKHYEHHLLFCLTSWSIKINIVGVLIEV